MPAHPHAHALSSCKRERAKRTEIATLFSVLSSHKFHAPIEISFSISLTFFRIFCDFLLSSIRWALNVARFWGESHNFYRALRISS